MARLAGWLAAARARQGGLLIVLVVLIGIAVSAAGFVLTRQQYEVTARQAFRAPAGTYATAVAKSLQAHVEATFPIGAYFSASKEVERWEFLAFAEKTLPRYPGTEALQWVPRVAADERRRYEERAADDGLYGFRIVERDAAGRPVPAGERAEYFPVYFVEPFEGNVDALGIDLGADPARSEALFQARDSGQLVAVGSAAPNGASRERTLLLIQPIYRQGDPLDIVEARREALLGFVVARLSVGRMIDAVLDEPEAAAGLDLYLLDMGAPAPSRLLYYRPSPLHSGPPRPLPVASLEEGLFVAVPYEVAGRRWSILVKPAPGQFEPQGALMSWAVAAIALLLMALLVQHLVAVRNRTRLIERSVAERTAELSASNTALQAEMVERQRIEQELRGAKEEAEVANRAKSQFLAMVSHELRTPLNAVIGFSEILSDEVFGPIGQERYRGYATDILYSGRHLLSLINDILDLSKVESSQSELHETIIDPADVVNAALRFLQERISASGLELRLDLPDNLPRIRADERALKQILINLLSNAVKFTLRGGSITVRGRHEPDGSLMLAVADTGIGIAKQHQAMVLLPFNQVDSSLARKYEGTGLGLTLSKTLAELHGGSLILESEEGQGTTVSMRLPPQRVFGQSQASLRLVSAAR